MAGGSSFTKTANRMCEVPAQYRMKAVVAPGSTQPVFCVQGELSAQLEYYAERIKLAVLQPARVD